MDHNNDMPLITRVICGKLVSRIDRFLRIMRSWSESSGSPDREGTGANAAHFKRRQVHCSSHVRVVQLGQLCLSSSPLLTSVYA
jgi:hypothetical protein